MELRKTYISNYSGLKGFTLMEVLLVLGMLAIIASATVFFSVNFYKQEILISERSQLISLLSTVRAQSMQNSNGAPHGIAIDPNGNVEYVLFSGASFATADAAELIPIPRLPRINFASGTPAEIIFTQLSGQSSYEGEIRLIDANQPDASTTITINYEGAIY